ncbi:MAG: transcriptional repressor [Bacteroidales bacterium]|jgi:Fur family ferric uptake transcriptional regulator|nr:transcriptional repressor [Bacteroidales bacterium]
MNEHLDSDYNFDEYFNRFQLYLDQHNLRSTYERKLLLHTIYNFENHFTVGTLRAYLKSKKHFLSSSTLYKTLKVFIDAGLITKQHFSPEGFPRYEVSHFRTSHNHICMNDSDTLIEFSDDRIDEIIKNIENVYNVTVTRHSFVIYCNSKNKDKNNNKLI